MIMEVLASICGGVLYKLSTVQAKNLLFNVSQHSICWAVCGSTYVLQYCNYVSGCPRILFDSTRCEDLVVTSGEDIIPGEAGKLVGPGRNKRTCGLGKVQVVFTLQTSLVRPPTWEHVANS